MGAHTPSLGSKQNPLEDAGIIVIICQIALPERQLPAPRKKNNPVTYRFLLGLLRCFLRTDMPISPTPQPSTPPNFGKKHV